MDGEIKQKSKLAYFAIAVVFIFLVAITYFIVRSISPAYLAKKYYDVPLPQIQRPNAPASDSLYEKGMRAFSAHDWKTAISAFSKIDNANSFHNRATYYLAHSYAGIKDYHKALEIFQSPDFSNGQYAHAAEWNKILMQMHLGVQKDSIINELRELKNDPTHLFRDEAAELLDKIE